MLESYLAQAVPSHEPALVNVGVEAVEPAFARILPQDVVAAVGEHGLGFGILGDEQGVVVDLPGKMLVVEVLVGVDKRSLVVSLAHHDEELLYGVAEGLVAHVAVGLDVDHRDEILVARAALCHEVLQLLGEVHARAEEVVRSHLQAISVRQLYVLHIPLVDALATFAAFDVDIGHVAVLAYRFPEHGALIVADVYPVDMTASVFALDVFPLSECREGEY